MSYIPIPPYEPSFKPVPNVTPFTYRDGVTMLKKLDGFIRYLNRVIVPFINETNAELAERVEADINNMITVVNSAITQLETETDAKLADMQTVVDSAITYVNTSIASLTTYVDEQVQLIIADGIQLQDPVMKAILQNPASQSRIVADALYAPFSVKTVQDTGRLSDDALNTFVNERGYLILHEMRKLAPGADARPIIQAAIDAAPDGTEIIIPEGDYVFLTSTDALFVDASDVKINKSNITVRGMGQGVTNITSGLARNIFAIIGDVAGTIKNVVISDMTLIGSQAASNQRGVTVRYAEQCTVERVTVATAGNNCINVFNSTNCKLIDVDVSDAHDFGILVYQSTGIVIDRPYSHDIGVGRAHLGIQLKASMNCVVISPRIERIHGYGLYTWTDGTFPDEGHTIINPRISDIFTVVGQFVGTGIYLNSGKRHKVIAPIIERSDAGAISINACEDVEIISPSILGSGSAVPGIGVSNVSLRCKIIGGIITGFTEGVLLDNSFRCLISGVVTLNLTATASSLSAAFHLRNGASLNKITDCLVRDTQATTTTNRGLFEEVGANYNRWTNCSVSGVTVRGDKAIQGTGSVDLFTTLGDAPAGRLTVTSPTADVTALKTAVDAIRVEMQKFGIIS